jgi:hypothetical protein
MNVRLNGRKMEGLNNGASIIQKLVVKLSNNVISTKCGNVVEVLESLTTSF